MNVWDSDRLWLKAKVFVERANQIDHADGGFPFWCALSLELLARSALTNIHPALNADPREDTNLLYACGISISGQPRSIPTHSVYLRLGKALPEFGDVHRKLCDYMALLRNQEIHSAELAFENLSASSWLPRFYEVCDLLCRSLGKTLEDFFGIETAANARKMIKALEKEIESAVKSKIAAFAKVFKEFPPKRQARLKREAAMPKWLPQGTYTACPACSSQGRLKGVPIRQNKPVYEDGALWVEEEFVASAFDCPACGLTFKSLEEILISGIQPHFTRSRETDLHELAQSEDYQEYDNM